MERTDTEAHGNGCAEAGGEPAADSADRTSRREFLARAGGAAGAGAGLALTGAVSACAAGSSSPRSAPSLPRLRSRASDTVSHGIQHLRSRPDLQPPQILIHVPPRGVQAGMIFTDCHGGPGQQGPIILDQAGRMVWFMPLSTSPDTAHRAFNFRVQSYRGQPVLTCFEGAMVSAHGQGAYKLYDSHYRQIAEVSGQNGYLGDLHEFLLTDQGTALFTCYGQATGTLPAAEGPHQGTYFYGVIQEVDVATGKLLFQWRSDDHIPLSASHQGVPANPSSPWDYIHLNSIAIDPTDGNLIVSARNTWSIYKVHRRTGKVLWTLGGKRDDFKMGRDTHFAFQHDAVLHSGGILTIFDNESGPPKQASQSRGLVLALDERTRHARFVRQFHHSPPVLSGALGSVQPLGRGHTFMGWGDSSYFTEYGPTGKVLFDGRFAAPTVSYRAFKQSWTGTPSGAPTVVLARSGTTATAYVSWNGATEIAQWRVLGGASPQSLVPIGIASKQGFETAITIPAAPASISVQALSASGAALGTSPAAA